MRHRQHHAPLQAMRGQGIVGGTVKAAAIRRDDHLIQRAELL